MKTDPDDVLYLPGRDMAVVGGAIIPTGSRQMSAGEVMVQLKNVVQMPYIGGDPRKQGLSLLDAALLSAAEKAADGDLDALNKILDRLLGKPLQQTIQATGTLKDFLEQVARSEQPYDEVDPLGD